MSPDPGAYIPAIEGSPGLGLYNIDLCQELSPLWLSTTLEMMDNTFVLFDNVVSSASCIQ
jgi:hypothetical protein